MTLPDQPAFPIQFGRYTLHRRLAVGGMAEVFEAHSDSLGGVGRTCVIKRILPSFSGEPRFVSLFIDEATILVGLGHPNIVKLYDFGQVDGAHFMALEHVRGTSLVDVLEHLFGQGVAVPPLCAAFLAREILLGLHHAHVHKNASGQLLNIVHRDVSPHNVLLSAGGAVKVVDFGIAQARNKVTLTTPGTVLGKFAYMAPEQATGARVDARADVFSVGVILHECLTGTRLFAGNSPVETIMKLATHTPAVPSSVRPNVPKALDAVVLKALQRDVANRHQSALEMAQGLTESMAYQGGLTPERFTAWLLGLGLPALVEASRTGAAQAPKARQRTMLTHAAIVDEHEEETSLLKELDVRRALEEDASQDPVTNLVREFRQEPNLWTLVALGERLTDVHKLDVAMATWRLAALGFAYRGLLVQAITALHHTRLYIPDRTWREDVLSLWDAANSDPRALRSIMKRVDRGGMLELLSSAASEEFGVDAAPLETRQPALLFGSVGREDLVRLVECARVVEHAPGAMVVKQGDPGETLYAVGQGRVVVFVDPPDGSARVNVSSLAEGDFFGEFGFITGERRSASVQSVGVSWVLELDRAPVAKLVPSHPGLARPLVDLYKKRVVDLLLVKHPLFGALPQDVRAALVEHAQLASFHAGDVVVAEGQRRGACLVVKQGALESMSRRSAVPVALGPGDFFGEGPALLGQPAQASLRAVSDAEVLRLEVGHLVQAAAQHPALKAALQRWKQA